MADLSYKPERWAVIAAEPDFEVSDTGRVRRAVSCSSHPAGYEMTLSRHKAGYFTVSLRGRPYYVHRLVVAAFVSPLPKGMVVNHINGLKTDNRADNLEVVTIAENNRHYRSRGLGAFKLNGAAVEAIITARASGVRAKDLADRHGVSHTTIKRILRRETYQDIVV